MFPFRPVIAAMLLFAVSAPVALAQSVPQTRAEITNLSQDALEAQASQLEPSESPERGTADETEIAQTETQRSAKAREAPDVRPEEVDARPEQNDPNPESLLATRELEPKEHSEAMVEQEELAIEAEDGVVATAQAQSSTVLEQDQQARITSRDPAPPPVSYIEVSGGIFLDMTIHDFDMARYVTGSEVVDVYARGAVMIDPEIGHAGDVDTAVIVMTHENGCITTIDNSRQAVYGYDQRVEAFGSAGMVGSENPRVHSTLTHTAEGTSQTTIPYFFIERYTESYLQEWSDFVKMCRGEAPSPVNIHDGAAPLAIGLAAWRSVREARQVAVAEILNEHTAGGA